MSLALGFKGGILGIGEESTYGTAVTRDKFIEITSDGLTVEEERVESATLNALYHDEDNVKRGSISVNGDIECEMRYSGMEKLLKHALGTVSTAEQTSFEVTSSNKYIDFKEDGGSEQSCSVAESTYKMGTSSSEDDTLCKAIKTALEDTGSGTYTVSYSTTTKKITIAVSGAVSAVQFLWKTGTHGSDNTDDHIGTLIGFDDSSDTSSSSSLTGDNTLTCVYKHTFSIDDDLPTGLSLEVDRDIKGFLVEGAKINTLSMSAEVNALLKATFGIIGEEMTACDVTSATLPTAPLISFEDIAVTYDGGSKDVKSIEWTLNNNLKTDRYYLNSRQIKEPERSAKLEVTGTLTIDFDGTTEYDDFRAASSKAIVATATGSTIKGSHTYKMTITFGQVKLTGGVPQIADAGIIPLELPFKAYAADSNDREVTIELINTLASV